VFIAHALGFDQVSLKSKLVFMKWSSAVNTLAIV